ncbi:MAG: tetratricopeptide repeat protein [Spirochaetes bacterium]|nr:tetratricopeptide repeat protein [Spirochaetota bacterium]
MVELAILTTVVVFLLGIIVYYIFRMIYVPQQVSQIQKMLDSKQFVNVIRIVKQMLSQKGNTSAFGQLHHFLGDAYMGTENTAMAVVEYRAALRDGSQESLQFEIRTRKKLAKALLALSKAEDALKEYLLLAKIDPNSYEPYFYIGKIYFESNNFENAAGYLIKAVEINPQFGDAFVYLGLSKFQGGKEGEALEFFIKALKFDPKNPNVHYHLGKIYRSGKDYMKALEEFELALKDADLKRKASLERGLCYIELGNYLKAIVELERGLASGGAPEDTITIATRYALAKCYEETRDLISAIEQWEKINSVRSGYLDVPDKLNTYANLRHDDSMKDYLTAPNVKFEEMVRRIVAVMHLKVLELKFETNGDALVLAQEADSVKWRTSKLLNRFIRLRRDTQKVQEVEIRQFLEAVKKNNVTRSVFICPSKFTDQAIAYATSRPIDLIDSSGLQSLLKKAQQVKLEPDGTAKPVTDETNEAENEHEEPSQERDA